MTLGGLVGLLTQPVQRSPLWPASWLPALNKSRVSKSAEVQRVREIYDDRLQFMGRVDALALDESLDVGDVSRAWLVWSSAAEAALADAYRFAGGPMPVKGLVMGGGTAGMRTVRSDGPMVRLARRNARRWLEAVMDALDALIRDGISLARSLELAIQWNGILRVGPVGPVTREDLQLSRGCGLGESRRLVEGLSL